MRLGSGAVVGTAGLHRWESEQPILAVAWFLGTWTPFALLSLIDQRTSYLYYMVIVMPGLYIAATYLASQLWRLRHRWIDGLLIVWALGVFVTAVLLFPFIPLF